VVSLFAHKKYDTLTMEYVDDNGGLHGAIFQLNKSQADMVRDQLVAHGAQVTSADAGATKQDKPEVAPENKEKMLAFLFGGNHNDCGCVSWKYVRSRCGGEAV